MGSIVTFYSYKGGVGRSMALANIALLLGRRGLKVLAVDWDLEAPGLERYFSYFEIRGERPGLLRMFMQARNGEHVDYRAFCATMKFEESPHPITLLPSGREHDDDYSHHLERFDWGSFFRDHGGGDFVERLRTQWRSDFDIVLIDSRTGLSDTGGICTIQLPDVVVAMFTANAQSLYGVRDVMRLAQRARQSLAYERMPLSVLPVPARWGMQEFRETQVWTERVAEAVQEFFADWLPRPLTARDVIERLRVPQRDYFSFGEKLAVVEQGTSDPTGMGFVYERVAGFLASDLSDIGALLGEDLARRAAVQPTQQPAPAERMDQRIDVFVSHDGSQAEGTLEFVERLRRMLHERLGREPSIFYEIAEIKVGDAWSDKIESALQWARVMVPILTPRYARSEFSMRELRYFLEKSGGSARAAVFPVTLGGADLPREISDRQTLDLRKYPTRAAASGEAPWLRELHQFAQAIADHLERAQNFRDKLKIGGEGPLMVVIPAGRFLMGSPPEEPDRMDSEGPQHEVRIARPFAMGVYAVTFDEYDRYCEATKREKPGDEGWGRANRPVIHVSWNDAQAYCAWLTEQTGRPYRLPSEAEWEYGCRAGTTTPFHFGDRLSTDQANFAIHHRKTLPVGSFPPNAFGLFETHGNVWEWCQDAWHGDYAGAPSDGSAWEGKEAVSRVVRGGSWGDGPRFCRAAFRLNFGPDLRGGYFGFRVCCSSPIE